MLLWTVIEYGNFPKEKSRRFVLRVGEGVIFIFSFNLCCIISHEWVATSFEGARQIEFIWCHEWVFLFCIARILLWAVWPLRKQLTEPLLTLLKLMSGPWEHSLSIGADSCSARTDNWKRKKRSEKILKQQINREKKIRYKNKRQKVIRENLKLEGVVIYLSIVIVMRSGLTDQSITSALKVIQCQSSNRSHEFKSLLCAALCKAEFLFKENSGGLIIFVSFLVKKILRETWETFGLKILQVLLECSIS